MVTRATIVAVLGVLVGLLSGQESSGSGNPPLTPEMSAKAIAYMEWILDAPFDAAQRKRYSEALAETWRSRNRSAVEGVLAMISMQEQLASVSSEDRAVVHRKVQGRFLEMLRSNPRDQAAQWLLGIHAAAHPNTETAPAAAGLQGRWTNGRISTIQYRDYYTEVHAPPTGNHFAYEFNADGTYAFSGLMQSTMYNCTTAMFSYETGAYEVAGDTVSLRAKENPYKMTNNCAPSSNREAPGKLVNRSYRFRIISEQQGPRLELVSSDGASSSFRRER